MSRDAEGGQELRVLLLEDNPDDAILIERELRTNGLAVRVERVDTKHAFGAALGAFEPDVILADYSLPAFDGLAALDMAREAAPHVPFLFVSGTIGEETAIDSLHRGAADYIIKDRLSRLTPAVRRAVQDAAERVERERLAFALAAYHLRVTRILDAMPEGFLELDGDFRIVFANEHAQAYAREPRPVVGRLISEAYPEFTGSPFERAALDVLDTRVAADVEGPLAPYGNWFRVTVFPTEGGIAIHFRDVDEQHRAEAARQEAEAMYRTLVEQMPASTYVVEMDDQGDPRPIYVSPHFEEMLGYTLEEWQADPELRHRLMDPHDGDEVAALAAEAMAAGQGFEAVYRTAARDGHMLWVHDRAGVVAGREPLTVEGVVLDISEQKRLEEDLKRALAEALAASRLKSTLITNTTHELMTPLTVIYGMSELLLDTDLDDMQHKLLERVRSAGSTLRALIRDMLDYAKLAADESLKLEPRDIELRPFVADIGRITATAAAEKGLDLRCDVDPDVAPVIHADPARLRQVLRILVDNAVKFTERGQVVIRALLIERAEGPCVRFMVVDSGIGIAASDHRQIFQPFWQADMSDIRHHGGMGLGLALAAELVEAMGGTIGFSSAPGAGSTFWFQIPVGVRVSNPFPGIEVSR